MGDDDIDLLAEICDDPDDEGSDYGRGWQDGYRVGWQSIAADLRRDIEHQSGWLWFTYGESMLLAVAKWIEGEAATPDGPRRWALPDELRGDGPCGDCGTYDNIVWFTESVLWNDVVRRDGDDAILCIPCFVIRVDAAGYYPTGWRLLADWHWETKNERARRLTDATPAADGQDGDGRG